MKTSELKKQLKKMGCFKVREGSNHEIWKSPVTGIYCWSTWQQRCAYRYSGKYLESCRA